MNIKRKQLLLKLLKQQKASKHVQSGKTITEGIHDKGNFKCVFMAGTPAAGKSTTCQDLFNTQYNISGFGLRVVNPDYPFVKYLQKDNLPPEFQTIGKQKWGSTKDRAVKVFQTQFNLFVQGRKGIIIDRTCGKFSDLARRKAIVEKNGYDTMMVFVTTPLSLALARNAKRDRHVGQDTVREVYDSVNSYKNAYMTLFGDNFVEVNTQKGGSVDYKIKSKIVEFINQPVENPVALAWIAAQRKLRNIKQGILKGSNLRESRSLTTKQAVMLSVKILSQENGGVNFNVRPAQMRDLQKAFALMIADKGQLTDKDVKNLVSEEGNGTKYEKLDGYMDIETTLQDIYQNYFGFSA